MGYGNKSNAKKIKKRFFIRNVNNADSGCTSCSVIIYEN